MLRSPLAAFLAALNIALGVIVISWLHNPPLGYIFHPAPSERPAGQTKQDAGSEQPSTDRPSPSDKRSHQPNAAGSNREPEKGWWEKLWTDPNATFAMFVAFFTLGLLWLGCAQFRDSRLLQRAYLSVEPLGIRQR